MALEPMSSCIMNARIASRHDLHSAQLRDLRLLDPQLSTSYPSAILARDSALVLNLEFIKVMILCCRLEHQPHSGRICSAETRVLVMWRRGQRHNWRSLAEYLMTCTDAVGSTSNQVDHVR